ncbi:kremen protein 1-like [Saccoglossus kowalevskii]
MYTHGNSITTIQGCIQTCRDDSEPIAVLSGADECYCGDDDTDYQQYGEAVPGEMINEYASYGTLQCSGDTGTEPYIQGCGGDYQLDVYDTTIGACGGQFTDDSGYIYSPNFPGKYPRDQNCIWTITVEDNHIIHLSILMDKISIGDYLDIRDGDDVTAPKITWNSMTVYSSGNTLWIQFYSNSDMITDLGFALPLQGKSY